MLLHSISLQSFRSYKKAEFNFSPLITIIIGVNTSGKTNLCEAIYSLATGDSFRTEKDIQMINLGEEISRVQGVIASDSEAIFKNNGIAAVADRSLAMTQKDEELKLEVMLAQGGITGGKFSKRFLVNGIARRKADFAGILPVVLFSPEELEIIIDGPSLRRRFLNEVLNQVDKEYRIAFLIYEKALRQRNALLNLAKETGKKNPKQFECWDSLLIKNGQIITQKRQALLDFINSEKKEIFDFKAVYDHSLISKERLAKYEKAEIAAGVTLVGPHRDDIIILMNNELRIKNCGAETKNENFAHNSKFIIPNSSLDIRFFGSRGQQRLAVLQLKILQLAYIEKILGLRPLLILDDIFSELDSGHIDLVLKMIEKQQTIITTTHREFLEKSKLGKSEMIEL